MRSRSARGASRERGRRLREGTTVSDERPPRPSDIARAALEAARAASAARPQPTRRRIAGPRRTWTGPRPDDDPQPLGRLVDSLVTQQDWSARTKVGSVFGRWSPIVGED